MRPASPILNLAANLRPSSPPQTPTTRSIPSFFIPKISPRASPGPGAGPGGLTPLIPPASLSQPPNFTAFDNEPLNHTPPVEIQELSPCSSNSSDAELSETEVEHSDGEARPNSPTPVPASHADQVDPFVSRARVVVQANFTIEELGDFDADDMQGRDDVIHPSAIEYAESERSSSRARLAPDDPHMINDLRNLNCRSPDTILSSDESDLDEADHQAILERIRAENRRQRMSQSSVGTKRTMSERGSESDHEDVRSYIGFDEAGSSARRLRRRVAGNRASLIFQDPPPRIDEVVEPPEELEETETLAKELPFYEYTTMEVDSPRSTDA